jgi:hypothetical protein
MLSDDILNIVKTKLSGRAMPPTERAKLEASSIAILSARFLLDMSPLTTLARRWESEQVRMHLRMLYSVQEGNEWMVSGSSPEPLIAEASAQLMHATIGNQPYMDVWDLVIQFIDIGFLPQGSIGELLGRVIGIRAMDRAINCLVSPCELKYQTPVSVVDYYKALLTVNAWDVLKNSKPANYKDLCKESADKRFEDCFANAYFHFSHYAKAGDVAPLRDKTTWALWLRGTAIHCQHQQLLTDRAEPIFFHEPGRFVAKDHMSIALHQDKTGKNVIPTRVEIQDVQHLNLFMPDKKLPYIAAVHCYALIKDEGITVGDTVGDTNRSTRQQWKQRDEAPPRYQINFRGLAAYRDIADSGIAGVSGRIRVAIDNIQNSMFTRHARQSTLEGVRLMLPMLNEENDANAWYDDDDLLGFHSLQQPTVENKKRQGDKKPPRSKKRGRRS